MDMSMGGYVKLGGTAAKDSCIKPQQKESFSEEASDVEWIGKPADVKGQKDIEC